MATAHLIPPALTNKDIIRFWKKVVIDNSTDDACWVWQKDRAKFGYGYFKFYRNNRKCSRRDGGHRISYFLAYGVWPAEQDVCHHCDNPPCVRPSHLFLGSRSDNMRDSIQKGRNRSRKGSMSPQAKLTETNVLYIRDVYRKGEKPSIRELAEEFGVCSASIQQVIYRTRWKHI